MPKVRPQMQFRWTTVLFVLLLVGYVLYAAAFIHRTSALLTPNSYVHETKRYYVLFDDAMISMRYARNWVNGYGLVWNPHGERVEGFTNPLWVAWMALLHILEPDRARTPLYVQLTGLALLWANIIVIGHLARKLTGSAWAALGAATFTAFYLPLNTWSLTGMEVSALTLIVSVATWGGLTMLERQRPRSWPYLLLGFSTLIRMDMAVPLAFLAGFMLFADRAHWRKHIAWAGAALAFFLGLQTAWRLRYYHAWLPNTYYLKMSGYPTVLRLKMGITRSYDFLVHMTPLPFLALLTRPNRRTRLLAWMVTGQLLYSTWVGGDAWEWFGGANRYLCPVSGLLFVLLFVFLTDLQRWLAARQTHPAAARVGLALTALFLFVHYNTIHGHSSLEEWTLQKPVATAVENTSYVYQAKLLEALTTPQATVAVIQAGRVPYFADRTFIDVLGKNDAYIAHLPMRAEDSPYFMPGHMKWDYDYSIRQRQPDVILGYWLEDVQPYLDDAYIPVWFPPANGNVWMRKDSPRILWERLGG